MTDTNLFESYRRELFGIAYRMLGSASDAEDVLQDAYLRYQGARDQQIRSPKAFLRTIVTRLCLDRLKSARTAREQYPGPWLPEPVLTGGEDPEAQVAVERQESIELAFLVLLESLTPQERAVFLLREVFEYEYEEIGAILSLSVANCRQLFHRSRERITAGKPRFTPSPVRRRQMVERFLAAVQTGQVGELTGMLASDVTFTADGGGKVPSVNKPVLGRDKVIRLFLGLGRSLSRLAQALGGDLRFDIVEVNGEPATLVWIGERLEVVYIFSGSDEGIGTIWAIRNPDKMGYILRQLHAGGAAIATT
jgi:RNA polymerase sigma-70 factor (ECF subfamily)